VTYTPTEQANIDIIQRMYAAENAHDPAGVAACFGRDAEIFGNGALLRTGRDNQSAHMVDNFTAFPDSKHETLLLVADREFVVVRWRVDATHAGPFAGLPPTGRRIELFATATFEVRDGEILRCWVDIDTAPLAKLLAVQEETK
jgi:predicted ester cyclase